MRLLRRLLGGDEHDAFDRPSREPLAPEATVYVIGDLHGRDDLLRSLLAKVDKHRAVCPQSFIVLVGDYVDRGDQSAQVLRRIHARDRQSDDVVCLMGNHEQMLLDFIDSPLDLGPRWLRHGGLQTLASFGIGGVSEGSAPEELLVTAEALRDNMGLELEKWLRGLPHFWTSGNLVVTHAALDPDLPLQIQSEHHMLWGHPAFLRRERKDGLWVAHGHTVTELPVVSQGRIAVDTGAVYTGRLTAAVLRQDGETEFLQA